MNLLPLLLAVFNSLGVSLGGKTGALIEQLVGTIGAVTLSEQELVAFAAPWITWANGIVDAGRDPTEAENAAALALADAIHANNQSLGAGGPGVALPAPPAI